MLFLYTRETNTGLYKLSKCSNPLRITLITNSNPEEESVINSAKSNIKDTLFIYSKFHRWQRNTPIFNKTPQLLSSTPQFLLSSGVRSGYTSSRAALRRRSSTKGNNATPDKTKPAFPHTCWKNPEHPQKETPAWQVLIRFLSQETATVVWFWRNHIFASEIRSFCGFIHQNLLHSNWKPKALLAV